ncbi:hypothetical protein ACM61V_11295 [Sphingomonas sp. TX0543]|uniref:hypothetical protein n=1 Tax=unclassified Sphingomonas TaxID=196159 RepID=UPI0010F9C80A|nr:hypothetical protein [Sphingomonas sp. 3P27F8]
MRWAWAFAVPLAALPAAGDAQLDSAKSLSFVKRDGRWTSIPLLCDSTNRDRAIVLGAPGQGGQMDLIAFAKPALTAQRMVVRLGLGDPGAGQIYYPLLNLAGGQIGNVHAINPGMVEAGATTPAVVSITLGKQTTNCRFVAQTRVLAITGRRSIQVVRTERNGYRYTSYNFDSELPEIVQPGGGQDTQASLTIDGGRLVDQVGGRRTYEFANRGFVYRVMVSVEPTHPGGGVEVTQGSRTIVREAFGAYTAALR